LYPHLRPTKPRGADANQAAFHSIVTPSVNSPAVEAATKPENASFECRLEELSRQMESLLKLHNANVVSETTNMVKVPGNEYTFATSLNLKIIVDSGSTDHIFCSKGLLFEINTGNTYSHITVANGTIVPTEGKGITQIFSKKVEAVVVPELETNLLSISKCTNSWNCNVTFTQKIIFQDRVFGKMIGEGRLIDGLYVINLSFSALATTFVTKFSQLWHNRLGHPSDSVLHSLNKSFVHDSNNYDPYHFAKQHKLYFPDSTNNTSEIFGLVHTDVWGNAPIDSKEGFKYFVIFIDDKSRATWLYLLKSKREMYTVFQDFCNMIQNQFGTAIKILRSDNGTEYTNHDFQALLKRLGIIHQTSCVGTPQQNGVAERKNRHLLEVTRVLLFF
jgi:Integrase core domain